MERKVRNSLRHLPDGEVDLVVQRLRAFEGDVFETRSMPRLPPFRQLDLDITVRPGSEPIHLRPYTVAPHLLPELDRQTYIQDDCRSCCENGTVLRAGTGRPHVHTYLLLFWATSEDYT